MSGASPSPVIEMTEVYKAFGPKKVLNGVNLTVGERESVVIIGGSGTGKSVTLKCILGLLQPDTGSIKVDGEEVTAIGTGRDRDRINAKFGMLFQGAALFDSLRVWENVAFGLKRENKTATAVRLSDGTVNLTLLNFPTDADAGDERGCDFVGLHHIGVWVEDLGEAAEQVKQAGGTF